MITKKNYLPLIAMGVAAVVLTGCFGAKDATDTTPVEQPVVASESGIVNGDAASVQYIGRLAGALDATQEDIIADCDAYELFDTSIQEVAEACGTYIAERDYTTPFTFVVGSKQVIEGFENALIGMKVGESKTISIPAAEAYGEWSEDNIIPVATEQLPAKEDGSDYNEGDEIATPFGAVKVYGLSGSSILIDANHPLAGNDLIFDLTVTEVTPGADLAGPEPVIPTAEPVALPEESTPPAETN
jgi:peptidylprolyl isomerase